MRDSKLGIYCHPDAVVATPDYAKKLVNEAGVDTFILRAGYDFNFPESLDKAIQVVRDLNAKVCCMVGVFWGGWPQMVDLPSKSQEAPCRFDVPGSAMDVQYIAKIQNLCKTFSPDSLCLTHARYRHPGYIEGIFDEGSRDTEYQSRMEAAGIPRDDILIARASWEKAMGLLDKAALLNNSEKGFEEFLCDLSQSDAIKRLLDFRRDTVHDAYLTYHKAVTDCGIPFGTNSFSPYGARITGHDYDGVFAETCEFVQPLLCYMEWHRYEPIAAWARYLMLHTGSDERTAIQAARNVLGLDDDRVCPESLRMLDTCGEDTDEAVLSFVTKEIEMCKPHVSKPYKLQIVLRGKQWNWGILDKLVDETKAIGVESLVFMGCEYLSKCSSPVIHGSTPTAGWS